MIEPGTGSSKESPVADRQARGAPDEVEGHSPFPIVGVGASAGGLEAFKGLLGAMGTDSGMAFLLVQHLDPYHESMLASILSRASAMPVLEAVHGLDVRPDHAYVIAPNTNMAVALGKIVLSPRVDIGGPHLPVDFLFRSLAENQRSRSIGVILSGTGSDGTLGLGEIKASGGITFAQDSASAGHPGMPKSAEDSGWADFVLTVPEIASRLLEVGRHAYLNPGSQAENLAEAQDHAAFRKILGQVRTGKNVDFTFYRDTTVRRRILRRMALQRHDRMSDYAQRLETDSAEVDALYDDLLINVTSFFRDPELFEALKERVYPEIVSGKSPMAPIRVWVAGCSTGQEAYSIAMTLVEFFDDKAVRPPIQIFATDLADQTALKKARAGIYPEGIEAEISADRLRRFFHREEHVYQVSKALRDMCIFARHNMTSDPPFSHLDLISCRNVLIYLAPALQKLVLPTFHYALDHPGFLVLGTAESIGENTNLFDVVDRENKIYGKKATVSRVPRPFSGDGSLGSPHLPARRMEPPAATAADFQREADRVLLGRYSPPGVLVNENMDIIQFRGQTSAYLVSPPGEPTNNILKMAREGLLIALKSALTKVRDGQPIRHEHLRIRGGGPSREIALEVVPIRPYGAGDGCALVLFHESGAELAAQATPLPAAEPEDPEHEADVTTLRQELTATREYMQSLAEQQDAANEELRSANEEILSSNEELQSTNEELETAKEELQSSNEELTTINEQLQHRNQELNRVNSDLTNLLSSTTIPVVMVGGDFRVRRFTAPARKVLNLVMSDIGRPLRDIDLPLRVPELEKLITEVIETVQPRERDVQDQDGNWFAVRVHPYRTLDNHIDGAVLVFVDIDSTKRNEGALRDADRRKNEFLATLAHELRNPMAPIRNAIEIMRLAGDDATAGAAARDVLHRQVGQLSRIVDDLIDLGRIVEGKVDLRMRRVALEAIVEFAIESTRSLMDSSGHRLNISMPARPLYLDADAARISQVLVNLLTNAAKYTKPGGQIWFTAERVQARRRSDAAIDEVLISVRDTGIGIVPELMPHIFDMFAQGERVYENSSGGLGIGLALVRRLVALHQGRVDVSSEGAGRGSEFRVYLPLASIGTEAPDAEMPFPDSEADVPVEQPRRRILVVDDNPDQMESLSMLLGLMGHEVFPAPDGNAAIESAIEHRPDLALIDIGLPGMSGYDVARRLRTQPELAGIVLVAQTGWGQAEDRRRSAEAGFDHHVVKPLELDALRRILAPPRPEGDPDVPGTAPG